MLTIRSPQYRAFQEQMESDFARKLRIALAGKYPRVLPRFPEAVQERIVSNMLGRAGTWGITWQSSLVTFAELMLAIAPNFDEQHHIRTALGLKWLGADRVMQSILERVPEEAWTAAEASGDDLPLFVPPELLNASPIEQTTDAIVLVLWDFSERMDPRRLAVDAHDLAKSLNLAEVRDAPLTLAVWQMLYGPTFRDPRVNPWVNDVFGASRTPREIVAMLKSRIALDHGRMV